MSDPLALPDWLRRAMEAQGKVDPEEVARAAAEIDLDALDPPPVPVQPTLDHGLFARTTDPRESHLSSVAVEAREGTTATFTPESHKHLILREYGASLTPLTDTQAWQRAGIGPRSGAWHRCSDLLDAAAIQQVDTVRDAETGNEVRRCTITAFGRSVLASLEAGRKVKPE